MRQLLSCEDTYRTPTSLPSPTPRGARDGLAGRVRLGHVTTRLFTLQSTNRNESVITPALRMDTSCRVTPGACHPRHQRDGGGERDRTDDLLLAKQALSQLSYTPAPDHEPT
jgi:hypothetical protein